MTPDRIAKLLTPFLAGPANAVVPASAISGVCHSEPGERSGEEPAVLSPAQLQHISTYIDILLRWNARINLTAIREPEEIVTRHFGESLFAARHLFPRNSAIVAKENQRSALERRVGQEGGVEGGRAALQGRVKREKSIGALAPEGHNRQVQANDQRPTTSDQAANSVADLGSGAGFPGIPIKLWAPHILLTLIESNHKKATFLREVTRALTLTNINIMTARAETLPEAKFNLVTLRAVERFETILAIAARLVAPGGCLALLIGTSQFDQARTILPELVWSAPEAIPESQSRILATARLSG